MTVNDTTNSLSTRIIFDSNKKPQSSFNYRDMGNVDSNCSHISMTEKGVLLIILPKTSIVYLTKRTDPYSQATNTSSVSPHIVEKKKLAKVVTYILNRGCMATFNY